MRRQGLAALLRFLFGPPRLQPQLQGERELALAMAQCECSPSPPRELLARPASPLSSQLCGKRLEGAQGCRGVSARLSRGSCLSQRTHLPSPVLPAVDMVTFGGERWIS